MEHSGGVTANFLRQRWLVQCTSSFSVAIIDSVESRCTRRRQRCDDNADGRTEPMDESTRKKRRQIGQTPPPQIAFLFVFRAFHSPPKKRVLRSSRREIAEREKKPQNEQRDLGGRPQSADRFRPIRHAKIVFRVPCAVVFHASFVRRAESDRPSETRRRERERNARAFDTAVVVQRRGERKKKKPKTNWQRPPVVAVNALPEERWK